MAPDAPRPFQTLAAALAPADALPAVSITGLTADSRAVEPGFAFVAVPGTEDDGHDYVAEAVEAGAVVVVAERAVGAPVPVVRVDDAHRALAVLAAAWYGHPAERLRLVGLTGTLGKTSVLTMLEAILNASGLAAGAIGSEIVGIRMPGVLEIETRHTTPDPMTLHHGFRALADRGAEVAAMEVSSHALDQQRVYGLRFDAGVFTNLVDLEHQDYHASFEEYARVKLGFCDQLAPDSPFLFGADSPALREALAGRPLRLVGCGFADDADVRIEDVRVSTGGTRYRLAFRTPLPRLDGSFREPGTLELGLRLFGRPHTLNSAFAAATALLLGVGEEAIREALAGFPPPTRRMELQPMGPLHVLDDTAGHPDSVAALFEVVRQIRRGAVHVVVAVRGRRGAAINERLAAALAHAYAAEPFATLIVTDSAEAVDELNTVAPEERAAYAGTLDRAGVPYRPAERLDEALDAVARTAAPGDLVVLAGAQGMIAGAARLRELLGAA